MSLIAATALCLQACDNAPRSEPSPPDPPASGTPRARPEATATAQASSLPEPDRPKVPMGPDGLPARIPLPGSRLPTVQDWNRSGQRVQVDDAEQLGCEAQMIREWIRLSCTNKKGELGAPQGAETKQEAGAPAYIFARADKVIRIETQLVPGRTYQAELKWKDGKRVFEIRWPKGQARPQIRFSSASAQADGDRSQEKHETGEKHRQRD